MMARQQTGLDANYQMRQDMQNDLTGSLALNACAAPDRGGL